jgi:hypothetical protein
MISAKKAASNQTGVIDFPCPVVAPRCPAKSFRNRFRHGHFRGPQVIDWSRPAVSRATLSEPVLGVEVMRILTRSSHADFEKAHPLLPRPESSRLAVKQRRNSGDGDYTLTSDRREMVTVAMRNGFARAERQRLGNAALPAMPPYRGRDWLPSDERGRERCR